MLDVVHDGIGGLEDAGVRKHDLHPRSGWTIHGRRALLFAAPFLVGGSIIALIAAGVISVDPARVHAPPWVIGAAAAMFLIPGALLAVHGVRGVQRARRAARLREQRPDEPWLADHAWNPAGARAELPSIWKEALAIASFAVFLAPFHWWAFTAGGDVPIMLFIGLFDVALFAIAGQSLHRLMQRRKYGGSTVRFGAFPYFPGDLVSLTFACENAIESAADLRFVLRCVQEEYVTRRCGSDGPRRVDVRCREIHRDVFRLEDTHDLRPGDGELELTFLLPPEAPGTDLASRPARFWELEARATTPGIDFAARYLVPVYERPERASLAT